MAPAAFGDMGYWDERYEKRKDFFDWLLPASAMEKAIKAAVNAAPRKDAKILHIGCGTSTLSFELRKLVQHPGQVHNTDFSGPAINLSKDREREIFGNDGAEAMNWSVVNLLSSEQIWKLREEGEASARGPFDVIVDKSTSDSICCADDVVVHLPYHIGSQRGVGLSETPVTTRSVLPFNLLAVHLAYLVRPGGRWVALSFSKDRFSGFKRGVSSQNCPSAGALEDTTTSSSQKSAAPMLPSSSTGVDSYYLDNPGELWEIVASEEILVREDVDGKNPGHVIHRPAIYHHIVVLVRTDTRLG